MKSSNKLFLGIIIIALLLLFYLIFTYKEEPFKEYEFGNDNLISNRAEIQYLDTITHVGMDILGIKNHMVLIKNQDKAINLGNDLETEAYVLNRNNQSVIYIKKVGSRNNNIKVISHELIHILQHINGDLVQLGNKQVMWKGELIENGYDIEYHKRPWEEDAFRRGKELEYDIKEILYE